ncbi:MULTISPECIES: DedA family protein [unclassified Brachybacterium]|uniref:DedA family protein n=1 Tax=unclassified Brachybacterium TaxID=2623841 RepID=UPI00360DDE5A
MEWIGSLPLLPAIALLYLVILLRAGGTYALGRGAHRLADRGRVADLLRRPRVVRAIGIVNRRGAPVVAISFLTVGFQTAANAAAGLTGMPLRRYLPALAIGGLAWAVVYATVGLTALFLWVELFLRSPGVAAVVLLALAAGVLVLVRRARGRRAADPAEVGADPDEAAVDTGEGSDGMR